MAFLQQNFTIGFSSANTTASQTSALEIPGCFLYAYLQVPTMTSGYGAASTPIYLQVSNDNINFSRLTNAESTQNTLVAGINDFTIGSAVSNKMVPLANFALRYVKVEISGVVTNPTQQTGVFRFVVVSNQ